MFHFPVNFRAGSSITEDIGNTTVALGREASLKCVVSNLLDYKVNAKLASIAKLYCTKVIKPQQTNHIILRLLGFT